MSRTDAQGRSRSTAIYYLLRRGERSHWHRIDAVEIWHYYSGAALTLKIANEGCGPHTVTLGPDVTAGERPQAIVPARRVAGGGEHRRLDAGGLHRGARLRVCTVRARAEGLGRTAVIRISVVGRRFQIQHVLCRDQAAAGDQDRGKDDVRARRA